MKATANTSSAADTTQDDDTESLEGCDKSWNDLIMKSYRRARSNFERIVETEGEEPYQAAVAKKRKYTLDPHDEDEEIPNFRLQKCVDSKKKVLSVTLESVLPLPPMIYWTLTEMNIKAEDELTLSHVPYLGDGDVNAFTEELMEAFPDGIHGTKVGCGEYINDFILYYTVKYCTEANGQIPMDKLFRLIYEHFPNKIQKNELKEIHPDLLARFEPHLVHSPVQFDDKGFQRENVTPNSLMHSYLILQCQKCALYDCPHHTNNAEHPLPKRQVDDRFEYTPIACGEGCYMARKDPLTSSSTSKRRSNGQLVVDIHPGKGKGSNLAISWSPQEESMTELLRSVGINDCCIIARSLMQEPGSDRPKTCNDVYQYFSRQGPLSPKVNLSREMPIKKPNANQLHRQFRSNKWHEDGKVQNQHAYVPCNHKGTCKEENCECFVRDKICTKFCGCYNDGCKLQFPGCRCSPGNCRTKQCPCYFASWECDPQTCQNCRCAPEDEWNDPANPKCKNVCFQRGLQKKLSARPSQVAGWGCFAEEPINKNEFISEYCGEIISNEESERRARISDKYRISYLFRLNNDQHVDATRKGNIIRFANHSSNPNCYAKVVVVNTEHRIGIFAQRNIQAGEELFFNYSYSSEHQLSFLNRELDRKNKVVVLKKEKARRVKTK